MKRSLSLLLAIGLAVCVAGCPGKKPPRDFMKENVDRWQAELASAGGSWEAWLEAVAPCHRDIRTFLDSRPAEISGLVGADGFLFFRRSLEVLVSGNLREQPDGRDPYPAIVDYKEQLAARGVDMLFCAIPVKGVLYPEKISDEVPGESGPSVNPNTRRLMLELAEAGVECVDLLPAFVKARDEPGDSLYMPLDTHWSPRGLQVAARVFAERIREYPWYAEAGPRVAYAVKKTTTKRRGDITAMLPQEVSIKYRPMELAAEQVVNPNGTLYEDDESSPILVLGDSYSGVFHFQDCQNAGVTAHIAREIGLPVDHLIGQGMGPNVRKKAARRGLGEGKKLVLWMLSERDLYNYRSPWKIIPVK